MTTLKRATPELLAAAIFLAAAACYVSTLAPGVLGGDAGELQFVPSILSLTHPTGYPLQTLLDKAWVSVVPWGTVAWRTNLLSALVAAGGVAAAAVTVRRSTGRADAALVAALALLVAPVYWGQAVLGDKYALNGLLTGLLLLTSLRFYRSPESAGSWALLSFVYGLSLAHHRGFLAFGPLVALFMLVLGRRALRRPRTWLAAMTFVLPLLLYFYLPWASARHLPPPHPRVYDWPSFVAFMSDTGYVRQIGWLPELENIRTYAGILSDNFHPLLLLLVVPGLGLRVADRAARAWVLFVLGCFLTQAYLGQNYDVPRQFVFYLPAYVCLAVLAGEATAGWGALARRFSTPGPALRGKAPALLAAVPVVLLIGLPLWQLPASWQDRRLEQYTEEPMGIFRQTLKTGGKANRLAAALALVPPRAMLVGDWEQATPLWYSQQVDGVCPGCTIHHGMEELEALKVAAREGQRPLIVARTLNQAADWSEPTSLGPLVALETAPAAEPPAGLVPLDFRFDTQLRLLGYTWPLGPASFRPGTVIPLSLVWQAVAPLPDYSISARLQQDEDVIWVTDISAPVLGMHPFGMLEPGQVISDYLEAPIPSDAAAGEYTLRLILYRTENGALRNAQVTGSQGEALGEAAAVLRFTVVP